MSTPTPATPAPGPIGGHTISRAAERVLRRELPAWSVPMGLGTILTWDATPNLDALSVAALPAGCISVPGPSDDPMRTPEGYGASYRLSVGVFSRAPEVPEGSPTPAQAPADDEDGDDAGWTRTYETSAQWAAAVRTVILRHLLVELGGIADTVTWTGEDLAAARPSGARTLGGAAVDFAVNVPEVDSVDLRPPLPDGSAPGRPRVGRVSVGTRVLPARRAVPAPDEPGADVSPETTVPPDAPTAPGG